MKDAVGSAVEVVLQESGRVASVNPVEHSPNLVVRNCLIGLKGDTSIVGSDLLNAKEVGH